MAMQVGGGHSKNPSSSDGEEGDVNRFPITRDFLGGCFEVVSKIDFFDSQLHPPLGWQKVIDLKTGIRYLKRLNHPPRPLSTSSSADHKTNRVSLSPPTMKITPTSSPPITLFQDDLNLIETSSTIVTPTVEKVKEALENAWMIRDPTSSSSSVKRLTRSCCSSPDLSTAVSSFKNDSMGEDLLTTNKKPKLNLDISL